MNEMIPYETAFSNETRDAFAKIFGGEEKAKEMYELQFRIARNREDMRAYTSAELAEAFGVVVAVSRMDELVL